MLQEDDGLTFAAAAGGRCRTSFTVRRSGDTVSITAVVDGDGYPEFARRRFALVLHGAVPEMITVDGQTVTALDGRFVIDNAGTDFAAEFAV